MACACSVFGAGRRQRGATLTPPNKIDLTGRRFGRLLLLHEGERTHRWQPRWLCRCDCGVLKTVDARHLREGRVVSCGCHRRDLATKHRMSQTPIYKSWSEMRRRCSNPNDSQWSLYGGRGITVCDRWSSFENFLADMGERLPGRTLDRINNDGP